MILYSLYQLILNRQFMDDRVMDDREETGLSDPLSPAELDRIRQFQMTTLAVFCSSLTHF
jgi:hypothetical protein